MYANAILISESKFESIIQNPPLMLSRGNSFQAGACLKRQRRQQRRLHMCCKYDSIKLECENIHIYILFDDLKQHIFVQDTVNLCGPVNIFLFERKPLNFPVRHICSADTQTSTISSHLSPMGKQAKTYTLTFLEVILETSVVCLDMKRCTGCWAGEEISMLL